MIAIDGGVVETTPELPLERRLRAHPRRRSAELIEWHEPKAVALENLYFGKNVHSAIGVGQARGVVDARRRPARRPLLRLHAAGGQDGRLRHRRRRQGPGPADGRRRCSGCPSRPRPTTRPTRSRWRSATAVAPRAAVEALDAAAARGSGWRDDRRRQRRGHRRAAPTTSSIDAAGVGYRLAVSAETLKAVPAVGERVFLHAHLISRDDSLALYGFATEDERDLFLSTDLGLRGRAEGRDGDALGRPGARAAARDRRRRRQALPGRARGSASGPPSGSSSSCARRSPASSRKASRRSSSEDDARALARDGLVGLGYTPLEAERLLDGIDERRRRGARRRSALRNAAAGQAA